MVQSAYGLREPEEELKDVGLKATAPPKFVSLEPLKSF